MKRVLITGSNGLLGQKLVDLILETGRAEIIATSKGINRHPIKTGYVYDELDITDIDQLRTVVSGHHPDVIINTAAMTNVDACEKNKELCWQLNVDAVKYLAEVCEEKNIHLIHLSTDFIFDGEKGPYSEEDEPNPLSYYGKSKLEAENILKASACKWTILRTIIVYGIVKDMSRSNIILWAKSALEKGAPINVVNDQWRMPTLAEDLAECCMLAAEKGIGGVFNASGKDMMSILEIVQAVADFWGLDKSLINPISAESLNQDAKRPVKTGFILDKARKELGYQPHSFKEGLEIVKQQLNG
ncbi:SDR family oxidoreductase [Rubrolithibacter danxiaensis]|uniref:SDR family oxidoreductase n=1 Tax=Rubrolithibacter danxiaensis TaxID=3390805 RepID=UPI003BF889EA